MTGCTSMEASQVRDKRLLRERHERLLDRYENATWDPPFKDGVELTLDGMFARADNVLHNHSTGIPHRLMSGREWGREYDMVRVQVPNITQDRADIQEEQDKLIRQGSKAGNNPHHATPHHAGRGAHHGNNNGHIAVATGSGHGNGHGNGHGIGHNRRHKVGPGEAPGGEEGGAAPRGKHGGGHHGGKGGLHVPAMVAPGEEENVNTSV